MGDRSKTKQALQAELDALRAELQNTHVMLQESRARCQSLIETSSGWVWEADRQGVYREVSGRVRELLGYVPEDLIGHSMFEQMPPAEAARVSEIYQTHVVAHTPIHALEIQYLNKEGAPVWQALNGVPFFAPDGTLAGFHAENFDITKYKRTGDALRSGEELFQTFVNQSPEGIVICDEEGVIVEWNSALAQMVGVPAADAVGRFLWDVQWEFSTLDRRTESSPEAIKQYLTGVLFSGDLQNSNVSSETLVRTPAGESKYLRLSKFTMQTEKGYLIGSIITDMTRTRLAARTLQESETWYRSLIEFLPDAILLHQDGRIVYLNPVGVALLNASGREDLTGKSVLEIVHPDYHALVIERSTRVISSGEVAPLREMKLLRLDGSVVDVEATTSRVFLQGRPMAQTVLRDVTERKRIANALVSSERQYRLLFDEMDSGFAVHEIVCDAHGQPVDYRFLSVNPAFETLTGLCAEDLVGKTVLEVLPETESVWIEQYGRVALTGEPAHFEQYASALGKYYEVRAFSPERGKFAVLVHDVTEKKRSEEQLRKLSHAVEQSPNSIVITDTFGVIEYVNPSFVQLTGYTVSEAVGQKPSILKSGHTTPEEYQNLWRTITSGEQWRGEFLNKKKSGELYWEAASISPVLDESGCVKHFVAIKEEISDRKQHERELQVVATVATALRKADTHAEILKNVLEQAVLVFDAQAAAVSQYDAVSERFVVQAVSGASGEQLRDYLGGQVDLATDVLETKKIYTADAVPDPGGTVFSETEDGIKLAAFVPLVTQQHAVGVLLIARPDALSESEKRILGALADMAASALHRTRLHEQTKRQVERLGLLHSIDATIASSLDLDVTLELLVGQITGRLKIDAAAVYLINPHSLHLECRAAAGFRYQMLGVQRSRSGDTLSGRIVSDRKPIYLSEFDAFVAARSTNELRFEGFTVYYGMPLIAKGQVKGVLELYNRSPLPSDIEWLDFLNTLAQQAAIAIDNIELFEHLQRSNLSLALAYDATIEGWSRVLDLRDKETEGHSLRVTELTAALAQDMHLPPDEIINLRRGALLHDIGKMGVPDEILLKPGPLDDREWEIMRKHPQYAYDMLAPIEYLRPALDIPRYHHERWDGSGYPFGLRGEAIPLAARIFAVVDAWDALISDRPYRDAWSREQAREYLLAESGKLFDSTVVEIFLSYIARKNPVV